MKRWGVWLTVLGLACGTIWAAEPLMFGRVERQTNDDLRLLLRAGVPVVLETNSCLYLEGSAASLAAAETLGYPVKVIDADSSGWDYLQAGLRPDSDTTRLQVMGTFVDSLENWVIVRVPRGLVIEGPEEARVFLYRIPHGPLSLPEEKEDRLSSNLERSFLTPDPLVQKIVQNVSTAAIDDYWLDLTSNPPTGTRYSPSQGCEDAAAYCKGVFESLGLAAEYHDYHATYAPNVVGTRLGAINPEKIYIVIGHVDDLPSSGLAPGADDNASGTVNVLESARAMSCYAYKNTVRYIACTGEEQGLVGSNAYSAMAKQRGDLIDGVINMDMISWEGNGSPDPENLDLNYNTLSQPLAERFARCATDYNTGLVVDAFYCPSLTASDHAGFWNRGYKAVCGITDNEGYCGHGGNYPYYHQSTDTIANNGDPAFFYSVVRTSVATLAEMAEPFKISFRKSAFACGLPVEVVLGDPDLNTNPTVVETVSLPVWSDTETTPEQILLTEESPNSLIFSGTINTAGAPPVAGDGSLSIEAGDTVHTSYTDLLDCDGGTNVPYSATASVDCTAPIISAVSESNVTINSATIQWSTDEASGSLVVWDFSTPPEQVTPSAGLVTSHTVNLTGLSQCTVYWYEVRSADVAGNIGRADNGGHWYHFETLGDFGSGPQPCHEGRVTIIDPTYSCSSSVALQLVDKDLNLNSGVAESTSILVTSSTEPAGETVVLTETGPDTSLFAGTILASPLSPGADGMIQVKNGDTLTATYRDMNDGTGEYSLSFDTATIDCQGPAITDLRLETITDQRATFKFTTGEAGDTVLEWGATPALGKTLSNAALTTAHEMIVNQFDTCQTFYFRVQSTDSFGNQAVADDHGQPFRFYSGMIPGLYWRETFEGSTSGWTLAGDWEIGAPQGKGGAGGGFKDPTAAYNNQKVLGHDLSGLGSYPGDYEPSVTESAKSPAQNASAWTNTKLLLYRRLNSGNNDDATLTLWVGSGRTLYRSNNILITENNFGLQTYDVKTLADGQPSVYLEFKQKANAGGQYSGWNVDDVIFKDGTLPDYGPCGGCASAPSFSGIQTAVDNDACAPSTVTVSWDRAPAWGSADGGTYAIYRGTAPGFPADVAHRVAAGVTTLSWTDPTPPAGQTLYYLVKAENNETCGGGPNNGGVLDSNTVYLSATESASQPLPGFIEGLTVSLVGGAHVRLEWPAVAHAPQYRILRSTTPLPAGFGAIGVTSSLLFEDLGQGADQATFFYLVRGLNACNQEGP